MSNFLKVVAMKKILFSIIFFLPLLALAQDDAGSNFGISFSGFVKNDVFFDTRQTVSAREGHFLLFPANVVEDDNGLDMNDKTNFNMLAVQSRLSGKITGPDAFGAATSGKIEGDFFAQANDNINLFRLRHAFVQLDWGNTQLLSGQYWNPFFVTDCFPGTVSFNTGAPIQPFARNPQIRLTHTVANTLKIMAAALGQRDYASIGTTGHSSSEYLRNSGIPDLHAQLHLKLGNSNVSVVAGGGAAYKQILPGLSTAAGYQTEEKVQGISAIGFLKLKTQALTWKSEVVYGENSTDLLQISGFGVTNVVNAQEAIVEYAPFKTLSAWTDLHSNGEKFQMGIFVGYTQNKGCTEELANIENSTSVFGRALNIESVWRVSPRVIFNSGKFRVAAEMEYTTANYADMNAPASELWDTYGAIQKTESVSNMRLLLATYYFF